MVIENSKQNKIESLENFEQKRENLIFDGFSKNLTSQLLEKYYEEAIKRNIPVREMSHNIYVYSLIDTLKKKFNLSSIESKNLFIKLTEFDSIFRPDFAYRGKDTPLSESIHKALKNKIQGIKKILKQKDISLEEEVLNLTIKIQNLSNETTGENSDWIRHYFKGTGSAYSYFFEK